MIRGIGVVLVVLGGLWLIKPGPIFASESENYYDPVDTKTPGTLRQSLHRLISQQRNLNYGSLWKYYRRTDRMSDGTVRDLYSDCEFNRIKANQGGPPGTECGYLTREHTWPKATWGGDRGKAYTDLFHVLPADAHTNGQKGLKPPGEVGEEYRVVGITKFGPARDDLEYSGLVFEPADRYKGDFARIYFYFVVRYLTGENRLSCSSWEPVREDGRGLEPWAMKMLLRWHREDPVSSAERNRNRQVYQIQGNRNPFVDHPEWAGKIWASDSAPRNRAVELGVDSNYWLTMKRSGAGWSHGEEKIHPYQKLADQGVSRARIRLWGGIPARGDSGTPRARPEKPKNMGWNRIW